VRFRRRLQPTLQFPTYLQQYLADNAGVLGLQAIVKYITQIQLFKVLKIRLVYLCTVKTTG
jgi:hypothetical protein